MDDWYLSEIQRHRADPTRLGSEAPIARSWGYHSGSEKHAKLRVILNVAKSFCRLLGTPAHTIIRLACDTEQGTAVAGFYDSPDGFSEPYILIDEAVVFRSDDPDEQVDVAIGLALHEASHILWSREVYRRMAEPDRDERLNGFENLLEDWRIEEKLIEEAPGWASYIYKTRKVLLADDWLRQVHAHWHEMVDTDKIGFLIACFVRTPYLLERHGEFATWTDLLGRNIFDELRKRLPHPPCSEDDVARQAAALLELVDEYWNRAFDAIQSRRSVSQEQLARLRAQHDADTERKNAAKNRTKLRPYSIDEFMRLLRRDGEVVHGSSEFDFFSVVDAEGMDSDDADTKKKLPLTRTHPPPRQRSLNATDRVVFEKPNPSAYGMKRYEVARRQVAGQIGRLQHLFAAPAEDSVRETIGSSGKLNPKKLWRSPFDDAIFTRRCQAPQPAESLIALLLDASGSMSEDQRIDRAFETAILLNESLAASDHHVEFFSHTADEEECLVQHHGSAGKQAAASLGNSYRARVSNFDDQAIRAVTALLEERYDDTLAKYLIVISDGLPCVPDGFEGEGIGVTKEAVAEARKRRWKVYSIGIGDAFCEPIYGNTWTMHCPSLDSLPKNFANLLHRLLRPA